MQLSFSNTVYGDQLNNQINSTHNILKSKFDSVLLIRKVNRL